MKQHISKRLLLILGAILILFVFVGGSVVYTLTHSPKARVMKAIANTLTSKDSTISDYLKTEDLRKLLATGKFQTDINLHLTELKANKTSNPEIRKLVTLAPHLSANTAVCYPEKKANSHIAIGCGGSDLLSFDINANDDILSLACPDLYTDALSIKTSTLASDYNSSAFCTMCKGKMLDDTANFYLFEGNLTNKTFSQRYQELFQDDNRQFYEDVSIKKVKGYDLTINDTVIHTKGYQLSFPGKHLEKFYKNALLLSLNQSSDSYQEISYLLEQKFGKIVIPETITCVVYIDTATNQMLKFTHTGDYQQNNNPYTLDVNLEWKDLEHPFDILDGTVTCKNKSSKEAICIINTTFTNAEQGISKSAHITYDTSNFDVHNVPLFIDASYSLSPDSGAFTANVSIAERQESNTISNMIASGSIMGMDCENLNLTIDELSLNIPKEEFVIALSGNYQLSTLTQSIQTPDQLRPLFEMNEDNLYGLLYEIIGNAMNPNSTISSFLQ